MKIALHSFYAVKNKEIISMPLNFQIYIAKIKNSISDAFFITCRCNRQNVDKFCSSLLILMT